MENRLLDEIAKAFKNTEYDEIPKFVSHINLQSSTSCNAIWARSLALQAITKNSDLPCLETGTYGAGPATGISLYEAAAVVASCVVSGGSVEAGPTARGTHSEYLSPAEPLFAAEVGHSVSGMSLTDVDSLVLKLLEKYEDRLDKPPLGQRHQDCYNMTNRQPKTDVIEHYRKARGDLREMELEFKYPSFYS